MPEISRTTYTPSYFPRTGGSSEPCAPSGIQYGRSTKRSSLSPVGERYNDNRNSKACVSPRCRLDGACELVRIAALCKERGGYCIVETQSCYSSLLWFTEYEDVLTTRLNLDFSSVPPTLASSSGSLLPVTVVNHTISSIRTRSVVRKTADVPVRGEEYRQSAFGIRPSLSVLGHLLRWYWRFVFLSRLSLLLKLFLLLARCHHTSLLLLAWPHSLSWPAPLTIASLTIIICSDRRHP